VEAGGQGHHAIRRKSKTAVCTVNQNKGIASMRTISMGKTSATADVSRRKIEWEAYAKIKCKIQKL